MQSNFQKVIEFNKQFGIKIFSEPQFNIFDDEPKLVAYRMSLIREEISELEEGVKTNDVIEIIDALADILYVVYGMGVSVGFNIDNAYLYASGDSNFMKTINYHKSKGINIPQKVNTFVLTLYSSFFDHSMQQLRNAMQSLEHSVKNKEYKLMTESLINLVFSAYTLGYIIGINVDEAYDIVHKSNMSKLCNDDRSAQDTVVWYLKNGPKDANGDMLYKTPAYRKSYDDKYYVVYDVEKSKILKSIYYTETDFSKILI